MCSVYADILVKTRAISEGLSITPWRCRRNGGIELCFFNVDTKWMWLVTTRPLYLLVQALATFGQALGDALADLDKVTKKTIPAPAGKRNTCRPARSLVPTLTEQWHFLTYGMSRCNVLPLSSFPTNSTFNSFAKQRRKRISYRITGVSEIGGLVA
jgi:hypothetical protein